MKITEMDINKQAFVFAAMHMLANRFQTLGDKIDPTITNKQWFVLAAVSKFTEAPPSIGDIAVLLGTSRQNVKKMAVILERHGFLQLEKDKSDCRVIRLILTEQCLGYFKGREAQEGEYLEKIFAGIDGKMLDNLHQSISKLLENTDSLLGGQQ